MNKILLKIFDTLHIRVFAYKFLNVSMKHPPHGLITQNNMLKSPEPIRYQSIALAINQILREEISGAFAEAGVFQGHTSKIIHMLAPDRTLYLFDTFEGFPKNKESMRDSRFDHTSNNFVLNIIGGSHNIIIKKGLIPETFSGLEEEKFAFVMIDLDLFKSTIDAMEFFYPRISPGGYVFLHDFNNLEWQRGVQKAVNEFLSDKPEQIIELPDMWGSVVFRKSK